ncbi:hypothetical protein R3P38DRAFT_2772265 [Favolaschia claudopus]|uniref:Uncharacterized protein n=1 Tax=Favolaschia claudopus TaxID=2862362 RepID=A0AAW0C6C2_9AGAR
MLLPFVFAVVMLRTMSTYPQTTMIVSANARPRASSPRARGHQPRTATGKKLKFKAFSSSSNLLGAIGNSEGAQAQGLADVIILRQMNRDSPAWWAHKVSYPWLLVSLNRYLSHMNKRYWDLTPNDTNPIEGSHAEDNQIKPTNRLILEAILLRDTIFVVFYTAEVRCSAKEQDAQNARIIQEMISSGVLQNPNNSLQSRMKSQAQRKAHASEKKRITDAELLTVKESRKLRNDLEATQQENETLRKQIAMLSQATFSATPSTPKKLQPVASSSQLRKPA